MTEKHDMRPGMSLDVVLMQGHIPDPLARLKPSKTYIVELTNPTQYNHPIHLHDHTFTVLDSNKKPITPCNHAPNWLNINQLGVHMDTQSMRHFKITEVLLKMGCP